MGQNNGYIYILTNPSFPQYVKIGYADDVEKRLAQLNRSECVPFAFQVYATYEVNSRLSDIQIHKLIDKINPNLRAIEFNEGKKRVREFYAMSREDAYAIFEAMAEIHGCKDKLKRNRQTKDEQADEAAAEEIQAESSERAGNFSFSKCQIPVGAVIEYGLDPSITCTVVDDRRVEYQGATMYLTGLAQLLSGKHCALAGPKYFKYKGEWLNDIRQRLGV